MSPSGLKKNKRRIKFIPQRETLRKFYLVPREPEKKKKDKSRSEGGRDELGGPG